MADNFRFAQLQPYALAGAGQVIGDTSITLKSMLDINGSALTMAADFGTVGYGTLEPGNSTLEEQISFTGLTNNANGTTTLTGVSSVSFVYPYTKTSGLLKTHAGASIFIISNTSGFYGDMVAKNDDATITGVYTFPDDPSRPHVPSDTDTSTATAFVTLGQLSRQAISGASNASPSVKGIVQIATQAQTDARTLIGSTSAYLSVNPTTLRSTLLSDYILDTSSTPNVIVITPSPAITSYQVGQIFSCKLANTNTSAYVTVNANGLGAKSVILSGYGSPTVGSLQSNQVITIEYDGTNAQVVSVPAQNVITSGTPTTGDLLYATNSAWTRLAAGTSPYILTSNGAGVAPSWQAIPTPLTITSGVTTWLANATGNVTIAHGLGKIPKFIRITATSAFGVSVQTPMSVGTYNGSSMAVAWIDASGGGTGGSGSATNYVLFIGYQEGTTESHATATFDSTNITLARTVTGSPATFTINVLWEAYA